MTDSTPNNPGEGNSGTRIERILGEVLKQPTPEARERCLAEACGGDANLRAEIESLLAAHTQAGDFLERPREQAPPGTIVADDEADNAMERIGTMIGRYKLLEQIGEGGFGVVYMAEQVEPVQRKVALKIVKAGMDTREVIARFEAERQALALMDHPNIAHVLDAGATQAGRPYFVMELVKGISITDFCDQKKLSPDERLDLFMKVCQAVQHAHQKGIIHRDIKPSNVLVTLHDGEPVPKVIDFGVAKALGQRLTEKTLFTGFTRMLGTPAYMSPEQAELRGLDVDTRSDIYSLGVLLYELLTGVTPLDRDTLARAALDEVRRMIQETEPQKPSTRVQTLGDRITEVATRRHTEPPRLVHFLRGDLDWIVMKCLEKDRRRRYDTPSGLVMDVQRHLGNEPVAARPPSQLYRLHKLIRRNKLVFAAGSIVAVALIVGLGVSIVAWDKEHAARKRAIVSQQEARKEAAKAAAISSFLQEMLRSADPDAHRGLDYTVREMLDDFSSGLSEQFTDQPEVEAVLRRTIGRAYERLGFGDQALIHQERALVLREQVFGSDSLPVAESLVDGAWAGLMIGTHNLTTWAELWTNAEPRVSRALEILRQHEGSGRETLMRALWVKQMFLLNLNEYKKADATVEEAAVVVAESPSPDDPILACMRHRMAAHMCGQGRFREAEIAAREALTMHRRVRPPEHYEIGHALRALGWSLEGQGKLAEARMAYEEGLSIFRRQFGYVGYDPWSVAALSRVLQQLEDWQALEAFLRQTLEDHRTGLAKSDLTPAWVDPADVARTLLWLADVVDAQGHGEEAKAYTSEAVRIVSELPAADFECADADTVNQLATVLRDRGHFEQAEVLLEQSIRCCEEGLRRFPASYECLTGLGHGLWTLGSLMVERDRKSDAEEAYRQAVDVFSKGSQDFPKDGSMKQEHAWSALLLARFLDDAGRKDEAVNAYRRAAALHQEGAEKFPANQFFVERLFQSQAKLAGLLRAQTRPEEAAACVEDVNRFSSRVIDSHDPRNSDSARHLIRLGNSLRWNADTSSLAVELLLKGYEALKTHGHSTEGLDTYALALALRDRGDFAEAERFLHQAMASHGSDKGDAAYLMHPLKQLAVLLRDQGRTNEAEGLYLEELQGRTERLGENDPRVSAWLFEYAVFLRRGGKLDEAYALADAELSRQTERLGEEDPRIARWGIGVGKLLLAQGNLTEAAALFRKGAEYVDPNQLNGVAWPLATSPDAAKRNGEIAVEFAEAAVAATDRKNLQIVDTLAAAYAEAGQFTNAVKVQLEAIALLPENNASLKADFEYRLHLYQSNLPFRGYWREANRLRDAGELDEAETLLLKELEVRRKMLEPDDPALASYLAVLALVLLDNNKFFEAEPYADECLKIREQQLPNNWLTFNARSLLGGSLLGQKRYAEAEPLLISGYERMKQREDKIPTAGKSRIKEAAERLVQLYEAWGKPDQAVEWRAKLPSGSHAESGKGD